MATKRKSPRLGHSIDTPPPKKGKTIASSPKPTKKTSSETITPSPEYSTRLSQLKNLKSGPLVKLCKLTPGYDLFLESPPGQAKPPSNAAIVKKILAAEFDENASPRNKSTTEKADGDTNEVDDENDTDSDNEALVLQSEMERQGKALKQLNTARAMAHNKYRARSGPSDPLVKALAKQVVIPLDDDFDNAYEDAWTQLSVLRSRAETNIPNTRQRPCRFCKQSTTVNDSSLQLCNTCLDKLNDVIPSDDGEAKNRKDDFEDNETGTKQTATTSNAPALDAIARRLLPPGMPTSDLSASDYLFYSKFNSKTLKSIADRQFVPLHEVDQMSFTQMTNQFTTTETRNITVNTGGTIVLDASRSFKPSKIASGDELLRRLAFLHRLEAKFKSSMLTAMNDTATVTTWIQRHGYLAALHGVESVRFFRMKDRSYDRRGISNPGDEIMDEMRYYKSSTSKVPINDPPTTSPRASNDAQESPAMNKEKKGGKSLTKKEAELCRINGWCLKFQRGNCPFDGKHEVTPRDESKSAFWVQHDTCARCQQDGAHKGGALQCPQH